MHFDAGAGVRFGSSAGRFDTGARLDAIGFVPGQLLATTQPFLEGSR